MAPECDLTLVDLYRWQPVLRVPLPHLLVEPDTSLSPNVAARAQLLKVMKGVRLLLNIASESGTRVLASRLQDQLIELMPEPAEVDSWPAVGKRRPGDEVGMIAQRTVPDSFLTEVWEE